jgi:hypothetical protein
MHPELDALARDFAAQQAAFWAANEKLNKSEARFQGAFMDDIPYNVLEEHSDIWRQWSEALHAMEDASKALLDRARELAEERRSAGR